jgi:phage repressor protein C with HTH and peptisase S24 domain
MSIKELLSNEKLSDRVKLIRKYNKLSQALFAKSIGLKQPTLSEIEKGTYPPSTAAMRLIAHQYHVSEEWLETGEGEMFKGGEDQGESKDQGEISRGRDAAGEIGGGLLPYNPDDVVVMQVYVTGGAGAPYEFIPADPIEEIILPIQFYSKDIVPVKVRGRSMERTLGDGAVVGVDRADRHIVNGEIFAVWLPYQGTVIKRLYLDNKRVLLRSDNEEFRPHDIEVALDEVDEHFIQGRVKWAIQML